jgi:hypothetical protein
VTDLISNTTVILLVLLTLAGAILVYMTIALSQLVVTKEDFEEKVSPLLGVVTPNDDEKVNK